jgi:hypothetical protein
MSDTADVQDGALRLVDEKLSGELKAFGFDPGVPVYAVDELDFDLDLVKKALFESTYRRPTTLPFYIGSRDPLDFTGPDLELDMVVELVQAFYAPREVRIGVTPVGCFDAPEWYLRGFAYKSGFDPHPDVICMHVYIATGGAANDFNHAIVQIVNHPSGVDPSTRLSYGS